jgi:hypothetical protein
MSSKGIVRLDDVVVLVATGTHRANSDDELRQVPELDRHQMPMIVSVSEMTENQGSGPRFSVTRTTACVHTALTPLAAPAFRYFGRNPRRSRLAPRAQLSSY